MLLNSLVLPNGIWQMQLFQINQSEDSSKITIMYYNPSGQLHQRSITSVFNYNRTYSITINKLLHRKHSLSFIVTWGAARGPRTWRGGRAAAWDPCARSRSRAARPAAPQSWSRPCHRPEFRLRFKQMNSQSTIGYNGISQYSEEAPTDVFKVLRTSILAADLSLLR